MDVAGFVFGVLPLLDRCISLLVACIGKTRQSRRAVEDLTKSFRHITSSYNRVRILFKNAQKRLPAPSVEECMDVMKINEEEIKMCLRILKPLEEQPEVNGKKRPISNAKKRACSLIRMFLKSEEISELTARADKIEANLGRVHNLLAVFSALGGGSLKDVDERIDGVCNVPFPSRIVADFGFDSIGRPLTNEGKLKNLLLRSSIPTATEAAQLGTLHCLQGMGGVGKTCTLISVGNNSDIRNFFRGGIFYILLGKDATTFDLQEKLAHIAEISGGLSVSQNIKEASSLMAAVPHLRRWLYGQAILYIIDDLWQSSFLQVLQSLPTLPGKMVISTRDLSIAQQIDSVITLAAHKPCGEVARRIFIKHARTCDDEISEIGCEDELQQVLSICGGLPIALAIAGSSVAQKVQSGNNVANVLHHYVISVSGKEALLVSSKNRGYEYASLDAAVDASVKQLAEDYGNGTENARHGKRDLEELFTGLAVLKNQTIVPATMLQNLWALNSTEEAEEIADLLVSHSLLSVLVKEVFPSRKSHEAGTAGYIMHDLVLGVCRNWAKRLGTFQIWHKRLLNGYGKFKAPSLDARVAIAGHPRAADCTHTPRVQVIEEISERPNIPHHPWWSDDVIPDGYIHQFLATHLVEGGCAQELLHLVLDARWCRRQMKCSGTLALQNDFDLVIMSVKQRKCEPMYGINMNSMIEQLSTISKALAGASGRLIVRPETFAYELFGRLSDARRNMRLVDLFLDSSENSEEKPWLRPLSQILPDPREGLAREIAIPGECISLCYFPCGTLLAASAGIDIVIIDQETGRIRSKLEGHSEPVNSVAVSEKGTMLASGSCDGTVRLWDVASCAQIGLPLVGHQDSVYCVAFTPDSNSVISGSCDNTVRIWSISKHSQDGSALFGHKDGIRCLAVSNDGHFVLSGSYDETIRKWNLETRAQEGDPFVKLSGGVTSIAISSDRRFIVTSSLGWGGGVDIFHASSGRLVRGLHGEYNRETDAIEVALSPDGNYIILVERTGIVTVMGIENGFPVRSRILDANCATVSPFGKQLAVGHSVNTIGVWSILSDAQSTCTQTAHIEAVRCITSTSDGQFFASCSRVGSLLVWDCANGKPRLIPIEWDAFDVENIAFSNNGRFIVSVDSQGTIVILDLRSRKQVAKMLQGRCDLINNLTADKVEEVLRSSNVDGSNCETVFSDLNFESKAKGSLEEHHALIFDNGMKKAVYHGSSGKFLGFLPSGVYNNTKCIACNENGVVAVGLESGDVLRFSLQR